MPEMNTDVLCLVNSKRKAMNQKQSLLQENLHGINLQIYQQNFTSKDLEYNIQNKVRLFSKASKFGGSEKAEVEGLSPAPLCRAVSMDWSCVGLFFRFQVTFLIIKPHYENTFLGKLPYLILMTTLFILLQILLSSSPALWHSTQRQGRPMCQGSDLSYP